MTNYVLRRVLRAIVLVVLVTGVSFVLFTVLPDANAAQLGAGGNANPTGFFDYLNQVLFHLNLGYSYHYHQSVTSLIFDRLPATLSLIVGAAALSLALGIPVGVVAATRRGQRFDLVAMRIALGVVSTPVFWLGLISLYLFASDIGKIPIFAGAGSYAGLTANPGQWLKSLILPWLVLAATGTAIYSRLLRIQMLEVMGNDYIRAARARGVSEQRAIWRHGAGAAIPSIVPLLGLGTGGLLGAAVLTEVAFRIDGIGLLSYTAIRDADFPTVQGTVLFVAMLIVLVNLIVDVGYACLDPRVRSA